MPYFDHFATTPVRPEVCKKMLEVNQNVFGNPSSIHKSGQNAKFVIENSRREIAESIGAKSKEIIFTSGGTEANNLVLWSLLRQDKKHIVTSKIEHPAVLKVISSLEEFGATHTAIDVDSGGRVNPEECKSALQTDTGLISIILGNNEVGTIQPLSEISLIAQENGIPIHSDAVQALGKIPIQTDTLGADYLSFASHKCYGPKGVGALYIKDGSHLSPLIVGGSQERGLRAGTENVAGIAGFALAVRMAVESIEKTTAHLNKLVQRFISGLTNCFPDVVFNGDPDHQLPGIISISLPGWRSDKMMVLLDRESIEVSAGSACGSGDVKPSAVLHAMGVTKELNLSTLRISFGKDNTETEVDQLVRVFSEILNKN